MESTSLLVSPREFESSSGTNAVRRVVLYMFLLKILLAEEAQNLYGVFL